MVDEGAAARTAAWGADSGRQMDSASTGAVCTVPESSAASRTSAGGERTRCWMRHKDRFVAADKRYYSMSISQVAAAAGRPASADSSESLARSRSACPHPECSLYCTTTAASRRGRPPARSSSYRPRPVAGWLSSWTPDPPT